MNLVDQLEALLFVSDAPVPVEILALAIGGTEGQVEQGLEILEARLEERGAVRLAKIAGGYQLSTKPEFAELVANYLKPQRQKLSRSLMEVLAIIAYRQPLTVTDIETVRGVQSDYSVKALQERRLIEEVGRKQAPGRPVLYGTTEQFLHQFNLNDLSQLPAIERDDNQVLAIVHSTLSASGKNEQI
ncbi:MAG TPA: SMC-Scp complex subunit ScpB [Fimbriimonadaceae bacterium]|nr:SMC-Scp complex subunit ScpB [Fimbriimonadaceae bacterium]